MSNSRHVGATDPTEPRWVESLRDRSSVLIRPITHLDAPAARQFVEALPPEARQARFPGGARRPGDRPLECLADVDYRRDFAFVAVAKEDAHVRIVGVSRFTSDASHVRGECSVWVADAWQRKGLGTLLLRHLIDIARARRLRSLYSIDSAEDLAQSRLAAILGFHTRPDRDDPTQLVHELDL